MISLLTVINYYFSKKNLLLIVIITEKMFLGFKNYSFFLEESMNFHVFELRLSQWFMISNTSFAAHLKDISKLVGLKAKISSLKVLNRIDGKFLLICMDHIVPGFKYVKTANCSSWVCPSQWLLRQREQSVKVR